MFFVIFSETTMTLLMLAEQLEEVFRPVKIMKDIHQQVVENNENYNSLECALSLIRNLRRSLNFSLSKLEQDIQLTLYLESLRYYFTIADSWLVKNDWCDYDREFVIEKLVFLNLILIKIND